MTEYKWSKVMSLGHQNYNEPQVFTAKIAEDTFSLDQESVVDPETQKWNFIFSPEQEDKEIAEDKFQKEHLSAEEMKEYGIKVSLIRQGLLERALAWEKKMQENEAQPSSYSDYIAKRLYRNLEGQSAKAKEE